MREKLQEYALMAEIFSALAIIASLIFVGLQINQNSATIKAQTRNALAEIARDNIKVGMDARFVNIWAKKKNGEELTPEENILMKAHNNLIFRTAENVYYQYNLGTFGEDEFEGYKSFFQYYFSDPATRETWTVMKPGFSANFVNEIDTLISEME